MHDFNEAVRYFSIASIERIIDRLCDNATDDNSRYIIMSAADHRRAEIASKRLFDPGLVPSWAWAAVM